MIPLYYENSPVSVNNKIELEVKLPYGSLQENTEQLLEITLVGKCNNDDCTYKLDYLITAETINNSPIIFNQDSNFLDLNAPQLTEYPRIKLQNILSELKEPILKIRLINQLINKDDDSFIDYLQFKLTTAFPISYPDYKVYIKALVEENAFIRKEEVDYPRNLLDAAIN